MKKILYFLTAAAAMLSMSCTKEADFSGANGGTKVTFAVSLEDGAVTRSGDGGSCDKLIYSVYDNEGKILPACPGGKEQGTATVTGLEAEVDLDLVKGQEYTVVFWAQHSDCKAYNTEDLKNVTVDYSGENNDDSRDAFYKAHNFTVATDQIEEVTLKRPFAQLNLGTTQADLDAAKAAGIEIVESKVKLSNVATGINLYTGAITDTDEVEVALGEVLGEDITVNVDGTLTAFKSLSMTYILVDDAADNTTAQPAILESAVFTLVDVDGAVVVLKDGLTNIPVQRNFRTNIVGDLLANDIKFAIVVDTDFSTTSNDVVEDNVIDEDTTPERAKELLEGGGIVRAVGGPDRVLDFSGLAVAQDLDLYVNGTIQEIKLGGNIPVTKAASVLHNITIKIGKDVEYPKFTFNEGAVENYTIEGNLNTNKPLTEAISSLNDTADNADNVVGNDGVNIKNFTVKNVKAEGNGKLYLNGENITIQNCVATGLNQTFVFMSGFEGLNILDNEMSFAAPNANDTHKNAITLCWPRGGEINIKGNTINNAGKHAIFFGKANESDKNTPLVVENNTINGAVEDGVKTDNLNNVTVSGNAINVNEYGVRIDRLQAGDASFTVTGNAINTKANNGSYGIYINNRDNKTVNANITVNSNTAGADLAKTNRLFATNGNGMTLTGDYEFPYMLAEGIALSSNGKTWGVSSAEGMVKLSELAANAKPNEGKEFEVRLLADIDMAGKVWTPLSAHFVNFDGNNKTISNLNCGFNSTGKSGFIGYLGAGTIKNLTLENVTAAGEQAGIIAGHSEAGTLENVTIKGNNTVSYKDVEYDESWGGVGAVFGVNSSGAERTLGVTIAEGATITVDRTGLVTESPAGNIYSMLKAVTVTDNGTIIEKADGITINVTAKTAEISKAAGMVYANENLFAKSGYSYKLVEDIDMKGIEWTSKFTLKDSNDGRNLTFDGNGKTISNWGTTGEALLVSYMNNQNITIKNLNLDGCSVNSSTVNAGLLVGQSELHTSSKITIENVNVNNSSVKSSKYAGGLVGWIAGGDEGKLNITNCSVKNSEFSANGSTAAFIGHDNAGITTIENAVVTGCNITGEDAEHTGIVIGTVQRETTMSVSEVSDNTVFDVADSEAVYGRVSGGILYMNGDVTVNNSTYLARAINEGYTTVYLTDSYNPTYVIPSAKDKTLKFVGLGNAANMVIDVANTGGNMSGSKVSFENVTLKLAENASYSGLQHIAEAAYKDCVFEGQHFLYGKSSFENCTFNNTGNNYNIWGYVAREAEFTNCKFNCYTKSVLLFHDTNPTTYNWTFSNCTFAAESKGDKAAIQMHAEYGINGTLNITKCSATGFADVNDGLWNELNNQNGTPTDLFDITVDGVKVH